MTQEELQKAITEGVTIFWNDPDPIEGNDYTVRFIDNIDEETATIQYGYEGQTELSEAEVFLSELITAEQLLNELFLLTEIEKKAKLSKEQSIRYVEIVEFLQQKEIEIPFGIEM